MKPKQIAKLKQEQKALKEGAAAHRAMAVLLLATHGDMSLSVYTRDHAKRLKSAYLKLGPGAFEDKRKSNRDRILTKAERTQILKVLERKRSCDVLPSSAEHWSTSLLADYILELTGKRYKSRTSHYLLFREAKLSFHLPGKTYEKSDPERRAKWVRETRPLLKQYWAEKDTVILCEDEMVLTNATTMQKIWLPKGQYPPVLEINSTRKRQNFYGFLNLKTGVQHTFITDYQTMYITAEVLSKVRKLYPTQKIALFWDNAGWHKGSKVTEWIEADGNIDTVPFPPYTPDLNPQEHVWKAGRAAVTHNRHITKLKDTAEQFIQYLTGRTFAYELLGFRAG
jgi:transposase